MGFYCTKYKKTVPHRGNTIIFYTYNMKKKLSIIYQVSQTMVFSVSIPLITCYLSYTDAILLIANEYTENLI